MVLMRDKDYPNYRIQLEYEVSFGREKKRADIVVTDKDNHNVPYIIVELKKPKLRDGKEQLKGYCNATVLLLEFGRMANRFHIITVKIPITLRTLAIYLMLTKNFQTLLGKSGLMRT
jgi:hypothetical protein